MRFIRQMLYIYKIVMHSTKQKQSRSDDEFETMPPEVETVHQHISSPLPNKPQQHPRVKLMSEKHKLGLKVSPLLSEPAYSPYQTQKNNFAQHGKILKIGSYTFKSNFQTGSIGSVDLVGHNFFSITLDPQSNSSRGNTWFYFSVEGVKGQAQFVVKGFNKSSSLFNDGMKLCYRDGKQNGKWRRGGTKISYQLSTDKDEQDRTYCLKFTFFFKTNEYSSIQFAYSFPYSFERLTQLITHLGHKVKCTSLGPSYDGRNIPLITVGNTNSKDLIVISGRVHPGETGSSFIAEGFLKDITSDTPYAHFLRQKFLFKIVPMINVDGVCRGNYRFSASGVDLNRKWKNPNQQHHPEVYYLKEMIRKQHSERQLRMYIDLHGHSRKKNVFFYGCCPNNSDQTYARAKAFPYLMSKIYNAFNYQDCCFSVQKDKEGTARVAIFKEIKIPEIFTLEASFCGPAGGVNFSDNQYEKLGRKLCQGISAYFYEPYENHPPGMKQLAVLKQSSMNELSNSPYLLKVGNDENSGSDSEPQKGECVEKQKQKEVKSIITSKQDISRKRNSNINSAQNQNRTMPKIQSALKQKSQASIFASQQNQQKQRDLYMYLLEAPAQVFEADFRNNRPTTNQRVHSQSKQAQHKNMKSHILNAQEANLQSINSEKPSERTKVNLMVSRQGAQYRRVRKMAEQSLRHDNVYSEPGLLQVKGIRGSKLEIDHVRPKMRSYLLQKTKFRRTSAEMFFKKPAKIQERELGRNQLNVLCRGRQIIF